MFQSLVGIIARLSLSLLLRQLFEGVERSNRWTQLELKMSQASFVSLLVGLIFLGSSEIDLHSLGDIDQSQGCAG